MESILKKPTSIVELVFKPQIPIVLQFWLRFAIGIADVQDFA